MSSNTPDSGYGFSRLRGGWDALQSRFTQQVETRSRQPSLFTKSIDIDEVDLAANLAEHYELFENTPLIHSSIRSFSSDVVSPGYRLEGEDAQVEYLEEWAEQAAIVGGAKHNDLQPFLKQIVNQRWGRGGALIEHVKDDPESTEYDVTGVHFIRPETVKALTQENKNILLSPDDDSSDAPTTARGETAAYVQYHDDALLGPFDRDDVALSQNDVTRSLLNPDIDELWGTPVTETIAEDVRGFKRILRANEQAIKSKAWGIWSIAFGRDVLEYEDDGRSVTEIIEWDESDQDTFIDDRIENLDPGEIVGHDGEIEFEKFEGEVPDVIDHLEFYISNITTALPTPLYMVGFESNINQFVTERQDERYQSLVDEERKTIERDLTPLLEDVLRRNQGIEEPDIELKIEPAEDESPIRSLDNEDVERIEVYAKALERLSGAADPATLIGEDHLRDLILQLPEDSAPGPDEEVPGADEVAAATNELERLMNQNQNQNQNQVPDQEQAPDRDEDAVVEADD